MSRYQADGAGRDVVDSAVGLVTVMVTETVMVMMPGEEDLIEK